MDTVLITGGTGLIGQALTTLLTEVGHKVIILTRDADKASDNKLVTYAHWDVNSRTIDTAAVQQADYIVHLAGANVAEKRWTSSRKKEILNSRTHSSELLFDILSKVDNKVKKVISASGIGFYGPDNGTPFTENDPCYDDFLGKTCLAWETGIQKMEQLGKKVVIFRTGIVLSLEGGALQEFYKPLKFGFATILGNGGQIISWIHIHDLVRLYLSAIVDHDLQGIFNAVGPNPVRHKDLVLTMAQVARGKSFVPVYVPGIGLKIGLGELSIEVLKSCKVSAAKVINTGFVFSYPEIRGALENLFKK